MAGGSPCTQTPDRPLVITRSRANRDKIRPFVSTAEPPSPEQLRLDVWLDIACAYRTRSEAQRACDAGKVTVNGERAKPHRKIAVGDRILMTTPSGRRRQLLVVATTERHVPKAQARELYDDVTPPPTPEEAELRDLLRRAGPVPGARQGSPGKRDRRLRRGFKER